MVVAMACALGLSAPAAADGPGVGTTVGLLEERGIAAWTTPGAFDNAETDEPRRAADGAAGAVRRHEFTA